MATNNGNKNAFEIRLEVLGMAVSLAESAYYAKLDQVKTQAGENKPYELPEDNRLRDAVKIAKKLYAFVEGPNAEDRSE